MEIIQIITNVLILGFLSFIFIKISKIKITEEIPKKKAIQNFEKNEILNDVIEFTINSGFECMVLPSFDGKNTLFIKKEDNSMAPILTIPTIDKKKGTTEYNYILDQIKEEIKKIKEKTNVKN